MNRYTIGLLVTVAAASAVASSGLPGKTVGPASRPSGGAPSGGQEAPASPQQQLVARG